MTKYPLMLTMALSGLNLQAQTSIITTETIMCSSSTPTEMNKNRAAHDSFITKKKKYIY
ncbi:hypothetical protein [Pedobacter sp. NJ-S-72]